MEKRQVLKLAALLLLAAVTLGGPYLDRGVDALSPIERAAFAVIYGLSPWRVEAAAMDVRARRLLRPGDIEDRSDVEEGEQNA